MNPISSLLYDQCTSSCLKRTHVIYYSSVLSVARLHHFYNKCTVQTCSQIFLTEGEHGAFERHGARAAKSVSRSGSVC